MVTIKKRALSERLAGSGPHRIHVGAGSVALPGWINTDVTTAAEYVLDVTRPWPVHRGTVEYVYGDNFIEHVTLDDARDFLRHARDALKPGGTIRLVVPDAEAIARTYLGIDAGRDELLARNRAQGRTLDHPVALLRDLCIECGHAQGYAWDEAALSAELRAAGFVGIRRYVAGESDDPVLRGIDQRTDPVEQRVLLVLEARR